MAAISSVDAAISLIAEAVESAAVVSSSALRATPWIDRAICSMVVALSSMPVARPEVSSLTPLMDAAISVIAERTSVAEVASSWALPLTAWTDAAVCSMAAAVSFRALVNRVAVLLTCSMDAAISLADDASCSAAASDGRRLRGRLLERGSHLAGRAGGVVQRADLVFRSGEHLLGDASQFIGPGGHAPGLLAQAGDFGIVGRCHVKPSCEFVRR